MVFPRGGDRYAVLYDDITQRKRAEAQQAVATTLNQYRVRLSDALGPLDQADQITLVASCALGEQLHADRVYCAEVEPGDEYMVLRRTTTPPAAARTSRGGIGSTILATTSFSEFALLS